MEIKPSLFIFEYFFNPEKRVFWGYLLSSIFIVNLYYLAPKIKNNSLDLLNYSTIKSYWLHKSSILDYKYFIVNYFLKTFLVMPIIFSAKTITLFIYKLLSDSFNTSSLYFDVHSISFQTVMISYTLALFVVGDLTRYLLHRFMHSNKILWEFHKIHHSPELLNPFTFYRVHPIENLLFGIRYALVVGLISGVFLFLFGAKVHINEMFGVNIFLFIFSVLGSNLRHSHIPIGYWNFLEHMFISPKQHQIHHSNKYYNKNYGGYLAVWDYIFSSLKTSKNINKLQFGLTTNSNKFNTDIEQYKTIKGLLLTPFSNIFLKFKGLL